MMLPSSFPVATTLESHALQVRRSPPLIYFIVTMYEQHQVCRSKPYVNNEGKAVGNVG
jgi:hypothetical protein